MVSILWNLILSTNISKAQDTNEVIHAPTRNRMEDPPKEVAQTQQPSMPESQNANAQWQPPQNSNLLWVWINEEGPFLTNANVVPTNNEDEGQPEGNEQAFNFSFTPMSSVPH